MSLDGRDLNGSSTVNLLVKSFEQIPMLEELGASPYVVGNPIDTDREDMFFGRQDVIERIRLQIDSKKHANVVLLEGNRRTGKTSILRQLQKPGTLSDWIVVYCSFQDADGDTDKAGLSTTNVYRLLARTIGWSLAEEKVFTWFPGEAAADPKRLFKLEFRKALDRVFQDEHPFEVLKIYLNSVLEAVKPRRVLLMLDEFDKLQEGIDSGVTSPQVPENIRHLLQHSNGLSAILTGSRRLKRLREQYWSALFGLGYRVEISELPKAEALRLVTDPVAGRLRYLPQACERLVDLCARQPFLIQSLCTRVFERARTGERTITVEAVNEAAKEMVTNNEHFRTLWDYAQTHRRRLILALCEASSDGPDAITLEFLLAKMELANVYIEHESHLGDDLEYLRELELIELDKSYRGGSYRISVPLLGMWIRQSIDLNDVTTRAREESRESQDE